MTLEGTKISVAELLAQLAGGAAIDELKDVYHLSDEQMLDLFGFAWLLAQKL